MECSSDSTLRHTILVGAVVSYRSLKQAYTTHPLRSTDTASDCTKCTLTRQLCILKYLTLELSAAKALRVTRIRSYNRELGLEPVLRITTPRYLKESTHAIRFPAHYSSPVQFINMHSVFLVFMQSWCFWQNSWKTSINFCRCRGECASSTTSSANSIMKSCMHAKRKRNGD